MSKVITKTPTCEDRFLQLHSVLGSEKAEKIDMMRLKVLKLRFYLSTTTNFTEHLPFQTLSPNHSMAATLQQEYWNLAKVYRKAGPRMKLRVTKRI